MKAIAVVDPPAGLNTSNCTAAQDDYDMLRKRNRRPRGASPAPRVLTTDVLDNKSIIHPFSADLSEGSDAPPDESAWDFVDDVEVAQETLKDIYRDFQAVRKGKWHRARPEFMRDFDFISRLPKGPALDYSKLGTSLPEPPASCEGRTLFIDLDETLAHTEMASLDDPNTKAIIRAVQRASAGGDTTETNGKKEGSSTPQLLPNLIFSSSGDSAEQAVALVYFRPYVREFLRLLSHRYQLVCYTASLRAYANTILNALDVDRRLSHRLYREHCTQYSTTDIYFKDLHGTGRDLSKCVVLDNRVISFGLNVSNGVLISSFLGSPNDNDLLCLLPFLLSLSRVRDIRATLRAHYGLESAIALYEGSSWQRRLNKILSDPNSCTDNVTQVFEQLQAEGIRAEEAQRRRRHLQARRHRQEEQPTIENYTRKSSSRRQLVQKSQTNFSKQGDEDEDKPTTADDGPKDNTLVFEDGAAQSPGQHQSSGQQQSTVQQQSPDEQQTPGQQYQSPGQQQSSEQQYQALGQQYQSYESQQIVQQQQPEQPIGQQQAEQPTAPMRLLTSSRNRTRRRSSDRRRRAGSRQRPTYRSHEPIAQVLNRPETPKPIISPANLQMVPQSSRGFDHGIVRQRPPGLPILTRGAAVRRPDHNMINTAPNTPPAHPAPQPLSSPVYQSQQTSYTVPYNNNNTPVFVTTSANRPPSPTVFWRHETPYYPEKQHIRNHSAGGNSPAVRTSYYSPPPLEYRPSQQQPYRSVSWQGGGSGSSLRKTSPPATYLMRQDNRCLQGSSLAARNNAAASLWLRGVQR